MAEPSHSSLSALVLTVVGGLGLALAGCQRLPVEDPGNPPQEMPDDTGPGTFSQDDTGDAEGGEPQTGCNPVAQTGCNPGQKCTALSITGSSDTYACVSDPGGLEPYGACTASLHDGIDGCPPGYVCLEGLEDAAACVPLCLTNGDCAGLCAYHPTDNIRYCADECSPFEPNCVTPLQCRRASDRFACKFPGNGDVGGQGAACEIAEDVGCTAGLACLAGALVQGCMDGNCCTTLCDLSGPDPCSGATTCNALLPNPAPGYEDIGACFVPT